MIAVNDEANINCRPNSHIPTGSRPGTSNTAVLGRPSALRQDAQGTFWHKDCVDSFRKTLVTFGFAQGVNCFPG